MNKQAGDIRLSCLSNDRSVRRLLGRVMPMLADWGLSLDDCTTSEIVLAETLNNIAEHAFPTQDEAVISLHLRADDRALYIAIQEAGLPMPGLTAPQGQPPDPHVPRADLPEGGFGWFLIRAQTSALTYHRRASGNHLAYSIRLSQPLSQTPSDCCAVRNAQAG